MKVAIIAMSNLHNRWHHRVTSRLFDCAKRGLVFTDEHRRKISEATKAAMTPEIRKQLSDLAKGRKASDATKAKMRHSHLTKVITPELKAAYSTAGKVWTGRKHSQESLKKMSESHKGPNTPSYQVTCPHCGKTGAARGMNGFHFDRCRFRLS